METERELMRLQGAGVGRWLGMFGRRVAKGEARDEGGGARKRKGGKGGVTKVFGERVRMERAGEGEGETGKAMEKETETETEGEGDGEARAREGERKRERD